jgi:electron transport complex protein RnfG
MKQQRMLTHGVILGVFCLGFGLLLAVTNLVTAEDIAARALEDRLNSLSQVVPDGIHDNNLVADAIAMKDGQGNEITVYRATKEGKVTGLAYEIFGSGYAGKMKLMLGVDAEGKVLGVRVLAHKEPWSGKDQKERRLDIALHRIEHRQSAARKMESEEGRRPV